MIEYLTFSQCLMLNGYRHYVRGLFWLYAGYPRYALGSFIKAYKIFERGLEYNNFFQCQYFNFDILANNIAKTILNG